MTKQIEISDEAWEILQAHRYQCGSQAADALEMDELFAVSEHAWWFPDSNEKVQSALGVIRERLA